MRGWNVIDDFAGVVYLAGGRGCLLGIAFRHHLLTRIGGMRRDGMDGVGYVGCGYSSSYRSTNQCGFGVDEACVVARGVCKS